MELRDMNQEQAKTAMGKAEIALLPIGAVEVHGNHLPICTDVYLAEGVCRLVEEKLPECVVLPAMPYGQIWSLKDKPGCITISDQTLASFIAEVGRSLCAQGIKKMAVINGHVGNVAAIKTGMRMLYDECDLKTYSFTYPGAERAIERVCTSKRPHKAYFHACEIETSYMLYLAEEKVDMSKAIVNYPEFPKDFDCTPTPWSKILDTAVMGDATAATREKGEAIINEVVENIVEILSAD